DGQEDLRGFEWRYLWRLCRDGSRQTLPGDARPVAGVAFSRDGQTLAASGGNGVRIWDVATHRHVRLVGVWVGSVAFAGAGKTLATCERSNSAIRLWDVAARCERGTLRPPAWAVAMALSPDNLLAAGCGDGTVHTWDLATRQEVGAPLKGHTGSI